jgi:hypothetical protein
MNTSSSRSREQDRNPIAQETLLTTTITAEEAKALTERIPLAETTIEAASRTREALKADREARAREDQITGSIPIKTMARELRL